MLQRFIALAVLLAWPSLLLAGPKEDALAAFEKFFTAFTAANAEEVAGLFAPDALFYGTGSQDLVTTPAGVRQYFDNALGTRVPGAVRAFPISTSALVLSDNAVLISGIWQTERIVDGKPTLAAPMRVSLTMSKRGDRWQIVQFHNSPRPNPPAPAAPAAPSVR